MANPYTSVSISGYNTDAPADDGSAVASNQLNWSKHKTKLADPLKTAIESMDTNVNSAFARLFGTTFNTKTGDYTISTSDRGKIIEVTALATITLVDAASAGTGFPIAVVNNSDSAVVTVDGNASETINGNTSITLYPGDAVILTCDGSSWVGIVVPGNATGTFTGTLTGGTTSPTQTFSYSKSGNKVTLRLTTADLLVTSNDANMTVTGLPTWLVPAQDQFYPCTFLQDNGIGGRGVVDVDSGGSLIFGFNSYTTGSFTASGSKGILDKWSVTYDLVIE